MGEPPRALHPYLPPTSADKLLSRLLLQITSCDPPTLRELDNAARPRHLAILPNRGSIIYTSS